MEDPVKKRIDSIDILRGIVMVIMALDHTRDFFHTTAWTDDALNLKTTTGALFLTRFVTHFCAPLFVFLSGTSIYLQSLRKSPQELSRFLLTRGLWLILVELTLVTLGETFDLRFRLIILQVIWVIGASMVLMALLQRLPFSLLLCIGAVIVLGHNALDFIERVPDFKAGFWWTLLHYARFTRYPITEGHVIGVIYPLLPWLGLMILGYCFGVFFTPSYTIEQRSRLFKKIGISLLLFFVVLRFLNVYGDPFPWEAQEEGFFTFLSFIKVHKYPPSLLYMCLTVGVGILALAFLEKVKNGFTTAMCTYGRVAFFYYLIHWYIIHGLALLSFYAQGHSFALAEELGKNIPMRYVVPADGLALPYVYLIWMLVVLFLYPLCKWYNQYKTGHPEKWWLSYL